MNKFPKILLIGGVHTSECLIKINSALELHNISIRILEKIMAKGLYNYIQPNNVIQPNIMSYVGISQAEVDILSEPIRSIVKTSNEYKTYVRDYAQFAKRLDIIETIEKLKSIGDNPLGEAVTNLLAFQAVVETNKLYKVELKDFSDIEDAMEAVL